MKERLLRLGVCVITAVYVATAVMLYLLFKLVPNDFNIHLLLSIIISGIFVTGLWYGGMRTVNKKAIVSLGCLLLLILPVVNTAAYVNNVQHSKYTAVRWEQHPEDRAWMFSQLKGQYQFTGMSEEEILEILGDPCVDQEKETYVYWFVKKKPQGQDQLLYCFYHESIWFPYEQIVVFELDEMQQVVDYHTAVIDH